MIFPVLAFLQSQTVDELVQSAQSVHAKISMLANPLMLLLHVQ